MSHPAGVRGLKLYEDRTEESKNLVAPRRGAWIETDEYIKNKMEESKSHPAGVRGLKHCIHRQKDVV